MPESQSSNPSIRESLDQLVRLLDEPWTDQGDGWYDVLNENIERLELALCEGESEPNRSASLAEISRAHPRLISICNEFQRDGRKLLRQAALVVRLSMRSYDASKAPFPELRAATASLIDAVERFQAMEGELNGEAARDLGGEG
jgi:hypothetical protein